MDSIVKAFRDYFSGMNTTDLEAAAEPAKGWFLETMQTLNSMPMVDLFRIALVAVGVWLALKVGKKLVKVALIVGIAFIIVTRFL